MSHRLAEAVSEDGIPDTLGGSIGPHLPVELIEKIIAHSWKNTVGRPQDRRRLHEALTEAHPRLGDIVDRVAMRIPIYSPIARPGEPGTYLCMEVDRREQDQCAPGGPDWQAILESSHSGAYSMEKCVYRPTHVFLEAPLMDKATKSPLAHGAFHRGSKLVLQGCTSVTILHLTPSKGMVTVSPPDDSVFRLLSTVSRLTHLHLDYDGDSSCKYNGRIWVGVALPTVTFLRMRCYPCCGMPSSSSAQGMSRHHPRCARTGLAQPFPNLRELQLDDPLFLKLLDPPASLTKLTIDAPPDAKPFCSIQEYNVGAGLRHGFMTAGDCSQLVSAGSVAPKKTIVVRTGRKQPVGWQHAMQACAAFGVSLVHEVAYHCDGA
ncbi:hypothetical protein OH77DRAFT_1438750 [Trametes cingulata]|nr:hypothetical protein OH77DRAFT_1438750 [Trametes cingulata]